MDNIPYLYMIVNKYKVPWYIIRTQYNKPSFEEYFDHFSYFEFNIPIECMIINRCKQE